MTVKAVLLVVLGIVLAFGSGTAVAAEQSSDQKRFDQQIEKGGGEMGVPVPGSVADQESTKKKRDPSRQESAEQNAQVTMGGAQYFVYGDVLKIEGDNYFIKDEESGNEVKLIVNKDTNMDCGTKPTSGGSMATKRDRQQSGATERQQAQGQRKDETATGSGFGSGCAFQKGDKVKAEVSDMGTVTTLKLMTAEQHGKSAASAGSFESQVPQPSGTATGKDTRDKSPDIQKEHMESAVAPPDLRPEHQMDTPKAAPQKQASIPGCPPGDAPKGEVWRGKVISFDKETLVAKNKTGEKRMHIDRCTQKGQTDTRGEMFKQGDRIEAYVAPDGHVISIGIIKAHPNYGKDDPEASG